MTDVILPQAIQDLADSLKSFPGMGTRSSRKLALDILNLTEENYTDLLANIQQVREKVTLCDNCGFFAQADTAATGQHLCSICSDSGRKSNQICVVEKPTDVLTVEKSQIFKGRYHVLQRLISPLDNIFAEDTTLSDLIDRRLSPHHPGQTQPMELILFFRSGFSSEATTAYLKEILQRKGLQNQISLSRLAQGLPLYYNPDTLDQATMMKALEDRRIIT